MRRPVCFAAVLFVLLMGLSLIAMPPGREFPEQTDGHIVNLTGRVKWKEYRVRRESGGWGTARESGGWGTAEKNGESGTAKESGGFGTEEKSGGPGSSKENGGFGIAAEKNTTVLCLTLEDVQIESGLPPGISFDLFADDKVRCVLEDDLEGQDRAAGIGNRVRIRGKIAVFSSPTCDGQFDSRFYYQQVQGFLFGLEDARLLSASAEGSVFMNALYRLRGELSRAVDAIYPDPQKASVMKAVLLGQSGLLDPDTKEMYQANGLIHIVCISGLHISLLGMGLFRILRRLRLPAAAAAPVSLAAIISYGLMTGMHASSFRAVLMFLFHVTAIVIGRTYDLLTALSVSAILLIVENPSVILYSGFQYSFAAVIAAGSMADLLPRGWKFLSVPASILPVQLWHNYTFPVYSVLLNLAVIPLMTVVMIAGLLSLSLFFVPGFRPAASLFGKGASFILFLYEWMCEKVQLLPGHTIIAGRPAPVLIILYFAMLAAAAWTGKQLQKKLSEGGFRTEISLRGKLSKYTPAAVQALISAAAVILLICIRVTPVFSLYMLDVGQGDALFMETGRGLSKLRILVDGGSSDRQNLKRYILKPFLLFHDAGYVDLAVLTHEDYDHCSGLIDLLKDSGRNGEVTVGSLVLPQVAESSKGERYLEIEKIAAQRGIPVIYLHRGQEIEYGGLRILCLHPEQNAVCEDPNEYSLTLLAKYDNFTALLTGDLEGEGEKRMVEYVRERGLAGLAKAGTSDTGLSKAGMEGASLSESGAAEVGVAAADLSETGVTETGVTETGVAAAEAGSLSVLKVAHHGSGGGTGREFLSVFCPRISLISCGVNNRYGHPAPELIDRLRETGTQIFDTRFDGQITVYLRKKGMYVRTAAERRE